MTALITIAAVFAISALGIAAPRFPEFRRRFPDRIRPVKSAQWQTRALDNLSVAEDLLDLLEARGVKKRELVILGNASFEVRWQ